MVAKGWVKKHPNYATSLFAFPADNHNYVYVLGFIFSVVLIIYIIKHFNMFDYINIGVILVVTTCSFVYPKFNFIFMLLFSCFFTLLTFPNPFKKGFAIKQHHLLIQVLYFLHKTLLLDFLAVIYIRFFCVPSNVFLKRLFLIFMISVCYIMSSRLYFIHVTFHKNTLPNAYLVLIYLILFLGVTVVYFRLLMNVASFFVLSAYHITPELLSPSVLFVFGADENIDSTKPDFSKAVSKNTDNKFSFINITQNRYHYRQYFNTTNAGNFKFLGYCIAFCGSAAAVGTFWYSKIQADQTTIQAQQAVLQTEQAKQQTYHTAREADVAAVDAGLLTKEEYYKRHPEDASN